MIHKIYGPPGTGKTTLVSSLINSLWSVAKKVVLLAPTGRAAKVISQYTSRPAYTIHKKILLPKSVRGKGIQFTLAPNKHSQTLVLVDDLSNKSASVLFCRGV